MKLIDLDEEFYDFDEEGGVDNAEVSEYDDEYDDSEDVEYECRIHHRRKNNYDNLIIDKLLVGIPTVIILGLIVGVLFIGYNRSISDNICEEAAADESLNENDGSTTIDLGSKESENKVAKASDSDSKKERENKETVASDSDSKESEGKETKLSDSDSKESEGKETKLSDSDSKKESERNETKANDSNSNEKKNSGNRSNDSLVNEIETEVISESKSTSNKTNYDTKKSDSVSESIAYVIKETESATKKPDVTIYKNEGQFSDDLEKALKKQIENNADDVEWIITEDYSKKDNGDKNTLKNNIIISQFKNNEKSSVSENNIKIMTNDGKEIQLKAF